MSNNTSIDPIEHKSVKVKTGNMCKVRNHLTNLYKKYGIVAEAINLIIGEDDDTPTIIDNLSETIEKVRNIDGVEVSHLGGNHITQPFTFSDSFVRLNWDCYNLGESNEPTSYYAPIPVASTTNAGIITSDDKRLITGLGSQSYSQIYRNNGPVGKKDTWVSDATDVYLQFDQYGPTNGTIDHHTHPGSALPFPKASSSSAGIISAEMYRNLNNWFTKDQCSENKINTYEEIVDFLDGTEDTSSIRDICIFEGHVSSQDFTIYQDTNYTSISQNDLIFLCPSDTYVIDGEICRNAHFYGRGGTELIPEKTESVVFQIDQSGVITCLNEIEGEPVTDVVFKTSSSSDISWRLETLRQRIGFITGTGSQSALQDANTLFNQNNTISISRRANLPVRLQSRLTTINNRLNTVETKCNNFTTNKVDVRKTIPSGQGSIISDYERDQNNGLLLFRQNSNTGKTSKIFLNEDVKLQSIENANFQLNVSSVNLQPTNINIGIDNGSNIELVKEESDNIININSDTINTESDNYLITNNDTFIVTGPSNNGQFLEGSKLTIDQNNGVNALYKTSSNDYYINLTNLGAKIGSSCRDQSNPNVNTNYSSITVHPTAMVLQVNNTLGPEVHLENLNNSNNVTIRSDGFTARAIGNNSNITLSVDQSSGLTIGFSDGSKINYGIDGTKYEIYNLPLMENYFKTHILRGYYGVDQDTNKSELTINLPFDILDTVTSINSIIPNESSSFIGITNNFERFKIYKSNISDVTHYYFQMENNSPLEIDEVVLGGHHIRNIIYLRHNNA